MTNAGRSDQPEHFDWSAIVQAHREIIKQGEEGFYTLSLEDRSRLWSSVGDLGEAGIAGPWYFEAPLLDNPHFMDEIDEVDVPCFIGIGCVDVRARRAEALRPLFFREVVVSVVENGLEVKPEAGKWSPTPVLLSQANQVGDALGEDVEKLAERQLERANQVSKRDGTAFSTALINEVIGDFPSLEGRLRPSATSYVLFTANRNASSFNVHLMNDYDALVDRLMEDPADCGGLRVLERLGDVDLSAKCDPLDFVPLNESQRSAVKAILGREHVTVVSGPPGCGKSQVVLSVLLNAWSSGVKTLFASTNNKAVDVVLERLGRFESDYPVVVRAGSQKRARVAEAMDHALAIVERSSRTETPDGSHQRHTEMTERRRALQAVVHGGVFATIDQQKKAAFRAYALGQKSQVEYAQVQQELLARLPKIHPTIESPDTAHSLFAESTHWLDQIASVRAVIDDDTVRKHDNQAKIRKLEEKRNRILAAFAYPVPSDLGWLATTVQLTESAKWAQNIDVKVQAVVDRDLEKTPWKPEFDRFASSDEARSWLTEAESFGPELRTMARSASQALAQLETYRGLCENGERELRSLGVEPDITVPGETLQFWLVEHRASAVASESWKANLPFGQSHKARKRLDLALEKVRDHLPASMWARIQVAEGSPHTYFLPIAEALEVLQKHQTGYRTAEEEVGLFEAFIDKSDESVTRLGLPALELVDPGQTWVEQARTLEDKGSVVVEAVRALERREQADKVGKTLRQLRSELEAKAAAIPAWQSYLEEPGSQFRVAIADLAETPTPHTLQVARQVLGSGTLSKFIESWRSANEMQVNVDELEGEALEIPNLADRIGVWWENRPHIFQALDVPPELPTPDHPVFVEVSRIEEWIGDWDEFTTTTGPEIEVRIASELDRANVELHRAASKVPDDFIEPCLERVEEILATNNPWPIDDIDLLFAQFDPRSLEASIASIDAELESMSFTNAKKSWLGRVRENPDGLETISKLSVEFRKNLKVQPKSVQDFVRMLDVLPVWVATGQSTQSIPLEPEMFDLLVVDEASQCTLTNILPLLYRAKRVVVIGDKNQLPAIPAISAAAEEAIFAKHGLEEIKHWLGHNENDVYSAGSGCLRGREGDVHSLDEHYRSHPLIIGFSNRNIYRQALTLRRHPEQRQGVDYPPGIYLRHVSGHAQPRDASWQNQPEAEAVVETAKVLIDQPYVDDVGIVTPFRMQRELINQIIEKRGINGIEVATAHGFQGDERDAMVFSPVLARGMGAGTVHWASAENLVNVAVTRAREVLVVATDTNFCKAQDGIIKKLVTYCEEVEGVRAASAAELALFTRLTMEDIDFRTHFVVADVEVDFVIKGRVRNLVVEVDGRQHAGSQAADDAKKAMLVANGYQVLNFSGREVIETPDYVIGEIRLAVDRH